MTKWSLQVSDETDKAVKAFLADQGGEAGDISTFVEKAVRTVLRRETIRQIKDHNAQYNQQEIMDTIDEAVAWARDSRS